MHDVFTDIVEQGGEFAEIARKWKRKAYRSAKKISVVLRMPEEDALQEVMANMWVAYRTYCKQQVRYDGGIWDVVIDGIKYTLVHPTTGERVEVPRWKAVPIDKRMSAASFVYLRMVQWQSNLFTLHYTARNGYEQAPEKVKLFNGKEKSTFVRVVFEETWDGQEVVDGGIESPDCAVERSELVRHMWGKLDETSRLVLGVCVGEDLPLPDCPDGLTDLAYLSLVLGISVADVSASLKRIAKSMPKHLQKFEIVQREHDGTVLRRRPVQELLERRHRCARA